MFKFKFQLLE